MGQKKKIGCHFGGKNNNMIGDWQFIPQNTPTCGCLLGATCKHDGRVHISSSSLPLFHFKNVSSAEQHDTLNCGWSQGSVFMHVKWHLVTALLSAVASKRWLSPTSFFFLLLSNAAYFTSKVPMMDIDLNRNTSSNNRRHKGGDFVLVSSFCFRASAWPLLLMILTFKLTILFHFW